MMKQAFIEPRSSTNVAAFNQAIGNQELLCATSDKFVLLKDIPFSTLTEMVFEYADTHDRELFEFLLQPANSIRKSSGSMNAKQPLKLANQKSPEALSIKLINRKNDEFTQVSGHHCSMEALNSAITAHGIWGTLKDQNITKAWNIALKPYALQKKICKTIIQGRVRSMDWTLPSSDLRQVASSSLIASLDGCDTTIDFLNRVCESLVAWFSDPIKKGFTGSNSREAKRPLCLAWFAIWLADRGIILFPQNAGYGRWAEFFPLRYRHFYTKWIRSREGVNQADAYFSMLSPLLAKGTSLREQARFLLATLNLIAPGFEQGLVSAAAIQLLRDRLELDDECTYILNTVWRLEALTLKSKNFDPDELHKLNNLVDQRRKHSSSTDSILWPWVDDPSATLVSRSHIARRNLNPGKNLTAHVNDLRTLFPAMAGKSASKLSSSLSAWLYFLSTIPDERVPANVVDISPSILDSLRQVDHKGTFRGFLIEHSVETERQRDAFSAVKRAWKSAAIESRNEDLICPVSDQLVSSKFGRGNERLASTARRSIDMELLELIIDENRADDFAFSRDREYRGRKLDYRLVVDSETQQSEFIWWPGPAVLLDLLLQIPLRNKQGRFLDSGEGDEFLVDISTVQEFKNELPTAVRHRKEAFIQKISLSAVKEEAGLGIFVNTNKTGRDYSFPWIQLDIAQNVMRVIAWQKRYNPIPRPVSDRDDSVSERAANAEPVWVFPIFRDPARHDFRPISQQIVLDYYRALLKRVEEKYNLKNGTSIRLFRGNGEAVYDIHSLRVTGVTRLLNLGVDPRIVRMLVGHSSLAMTWYYEDISNSRVSSAMEKAMQAGTPTRESLLAMSPGERQDFLSRLFNRSTGSAPGVNLLKTLLEERSPLVEIGVDGICPGTRCSDAGVWRPRACALCPYWVTGPAFLPGQVLKLNNLMAELILHQETVEKLRDQLYAQRGRGEPIRAIQAEIRSEEEFIDNVLTEWEAQLQYVKKSEAEMKAWPRNDAPNSVSPNDLPALMSQDTSKLGVALQESHHLELFTRLIEGAKNIQGFVPVIGARHARDEMLLEIARHSSKSNLFYTLDPSNRKIALDSFALIILEQSQTFDQIEGLINGSTSITALPDAATWIEGLAPDYKLLGSPP